MRRKQDRRRGQDWPDWQLIRASFMTIYNDQRWRNIHLMNIFLRIYTHTINASRSYRFRSSLK